MEIIRTIDGVKYLMRDPRPVKELRRMYAAFLLKYPDSKLTIHQWLNRGRIYKRMK